MRLASPFKMRLLIFFARQLGKILFGIQKSSIQTFVDFPIIAITEKYEYAPKHIKIYDFFLGLISVVNCTVQKDLQRVLKYNQGIWN